MVKMVIKNFKEILKPKFDSIPNELKKASQWVLWKGKQNNHEVWEKVPCQTNGKLASSTDPNTWASFADIQAAYEYAPHKYGGIGFVLTKDDPYAVMDIDSVNMKTPPPYALELSNISFAEQSPSKTGIHVWVKFNHDKEKYMNKVVNSNIEIYDTGRFMTVTGDVITDKPIAEGESVQLVVDKYFTRLSKKLALMETNEHPLVQLDDKSVIQRMLSSKNGEKIKALLNGDWSIYVSHSEADFALCSHLAYWTRNNIEQIDRLFKSSGLYRVEKWSRDDYRMETIRKSLCETPYSDSSEQLLIVNGKQTFIPLGYKVDGGNLYQTKIIKGLEVLQLICRTVPILTKRLVDIETFEEGYELRWNDNQKERVEIVSSRSMAETKEMLNLRNIGFPVTSNNSRKIIEFLEKFQTINTVPIGKSVGRIGLIKGEIIHPLLEQNFTINPQSSGERQLHQAFKEKGTLQDWKENILDVIKPFPKVMFMTLSSFASVLLHDYDVPSFIVDLSGNTSQGKSTALKVASSVWGVPSLHGYMQTFNATPISFERKSVFLNSYPFIVDDSKSGDYRIYEDIIYSFASGRGRARGALQGSCLEGTWQQIMLTSGEAKLSSYVMKNSGGVEGRIVHIEDEPFLGVENNFLTRLHNDNLGKTYGVVGKEFVRRLNNLSPEEKDKHKKQYRDLRDNYIKLAGENHVLRRLSNYYAIIHHAAELLNEWFAFGIDPKLCIELFADDSLNNAGTNKPYEILGNLLDELSSHLITVDNDPQKPTPSHMNAFIKDGTLYLMRNYLKERLGADMITIRREWQKQGLTLKGKDNDTTSVRHRSNTIRAVGVNPETLTLLGISF